MKRLTAIVVLLTFWISPLRAASDTFVDYQNYNHGYCPECGSFPCRCGERAAGNNLAPEEAPVPPPPPAGPGFSYGGPPAPAPNGRVPPPPPGVAAKTPPPPAPPTPACKKPEPCAPAAVCATNCGVRLIWVGLGIVVLATGAAIIISSNNGAAPFH